MGEVYLVNFLWDATVSHWWFDIGSGNGLVLSGNKLLLEPTLMLSLICAWINVWVNNRKAGDLRRHHAHYDVTVMDGFAGYMRINQTRFKHMGQFGYTRMEDCRAALAVYSMRESSAEAPLIVTGSSFQESYSPGICLTDTDNVRVENNVFYRTVGSGKGFLSCKYILPTL